jgi:hypothetical protein
VPTWINFDLDMSQLQNIRKDNADDEDDQDLP